MAATIDYGYKTGTRRIISMKVKAGQAIAANDLVDLDSSGYLQACGAGDVPFGVAFGSCSAPSADGDIEIGVDTSDQSTYDYPLSAGSIALSLIGKACDVGGAQSINASAATDGCIEILDVNTATSLVTVRLIRKPANVA